MSKGYWEFFAGSNEVKVLNWVLGKHESLVNAGRGLSSIEKAVSPSHLTLGFVLKASH